VDTDDVMRRGWGWPAPNPDDFLKFFSRSAGFGWAVIKIDRKDAGDMG
jgi:hypothetical protein